LPNTGWPDALGFLQVGQSPLGLRIPLIGCKLEPTGSFPLILRYAETVNVHLAESALSLCISLIGRKPESLIEGAMDADKLCN